MIGQNIVKMNLDVTVNDHCAGHRVRSYKV